MQGTIYKILGSGDNPVARILADFDSPEEAGLAKTMIDELLTSALAEVDRLLADGGGQADSTEVSRIFSRQGLGEEIDWGPHNSPSVEEDEMTWDVPATFDLEDAYTMLSAMGAKQVALQEQIGEPWRNAAYPLGAAYIESECDCEQCDHVEIFSADEPSENFEPLYSAIIQKRTLH